MRLIKEITRTKTIPSGSAAGTYLLDIETLQDYDEVESISLVEITNGKATGNNNYLIGLKHEGTGDIIFDPMPKQLLLISYEEQSTAMLSIPDRKKDMAGLPAKGIIYSLSIVTEQTLDQDLKLSVTFSYKKHPRK